VRICADYTNTPGREPVTFALWLNILSDTVVSLQFNPRQMPLIPFSHALSLVKY
jgi:hypothetical protein